MAAIAVFYVLTKLPRFEFLNVFDAMDGKKVLVGRTFYLGSEFPVAVTLASLAVALGLIALSVARVRSRDF